MHCYRTCFLVLLQLHELNGSDRLVGECEAVLHLDLSSLASTQSTSIGFDILDQDRYGYNAGSGGRKADGLSLDEVIAHISVHELLWIAL